MSDTSQPANSDSVDSTGASAPEPIKEQSESVHDPRVEPVPVSSAVHPPSFEAALDGPGAGQPQRPSRTSEYSPTDAIAYAWRKFSKDPTTVLIPVILGSIAQGIVLVIFYVALFAGLFGIAAASNGEGGGGLEFAFILVFFILYFAAFLVFQIIYAGWLRAALAVTGGETLSLRELYQGWSRKGVVTTAALIAVALAVIELVLSLIPGIGVLLAIVATFVVLYYVQFAMVFVVDQGLAPMDAVRASFSLAHSHSSTLLIFDILAVLLVGVGTCICFVGSWVAVPIVLVGVAYTYRRLQQQPIVE